MAKWLSKGCIVHALTFAYGQRASKEVDVARQLVRDLSEKARAEGWGRIEEHKILDVGFMKELWRGTQLTDESVEIERDYTTSVVVPVRNVVMLSIAVAYAYSLYEETGDRVYVTYGAHGDDIAPREDTGEPRYPDCSPECIEALQASFRICHFRSHRVIEIWSPSREGLRKSDLLRQTYRLVGNLVYRTLSCYLSGRVHCGNCESCVNRHKAFLEAGIPDCTPYQKPPGDPASFMELEEEGVYIHESCRRRSSVE
jgi:7-cyano-7-deazaguanine synthase